MCDGKIYLWEKLSGIFQINPFIYDIINKSGPNI